tara:strand:- start:150 stop:629 length:480 start_codon:yes stop_codon:yes gene_type:complete
MFNDMIKIYILLIFLSILIIINISLNSIANVKTNLIKNNKIETFDLSSSGVTSKNRDFETKPGLYYKYNNIREYDLYNKLIKYKNKLTDMDENDLGDIKRKIKNQLKDISIKIGSGDNSIDAAIRNYIIENKKFTKMDKCFNDGNYGVGNYGAGGCFYN